jgi:hypothetical protein
VGEYLYQLLKKCHTYILPCDYLLCPEMQGEIFFSSSEEEESDDDSQASDEDDDLSTDTEVSK